jgi:hypothetical protein
MSRVSPVTPYVRESELQFTFRYAWLQYRNVGAGVDYQVPNFFCSIGKRGSTSLLCDRNRWFSDSIYRCIKAGGAVVLHAFLPFPELYDSVLESCLVGFDGFSPVDSKRLERSVLFLPPGGSELPGSLRSRVGHWLAKWPIPSHL